MAQVVDALDLIPLCVRQKVELEVSAYLLSKNNLRIALPNVVFDFGYGTCVTVHLPLFLVCCDE